MGGGGEGGRHISQLDVKKSGEHNALWDNKWELMNSSYLAKILIKKWECPLWSSSKVGTNCII